MDLSVAFLAFWAGFLLVSPIYLIHPNRFLSGFLDQWNYSLKGHHEGISYNPWSDWWLYYIRTGLIPGLTWPVFLLSLAGLLVMLRSREGWIVTATIVWLYLVFEHGQAKPYPFSARYLLLLAPLLCLSAAHGLVRGAACLRQKLPAAAVYSVCGALFIIPPLVKTVLISEEALHDTRITAGSWMEQAIPPGSNIVVPDVLPYRPASQYRGRGWRVRPLSDVREPGSIMRAESPPYFVLSSFEYQRYLDKPEAVPHNTRFYRRLMGEFRLIKEFHPRWLTYGFHSPVIHIYQPPIQPGGLPVDPGKITGPAE